MKHFVDPTKLTNQLILWLRFNLLFSVAGSIIWLLLLIFAFFMQSNPTALEDNRHLVLVSIRISMLTFFIGLFVIYVVNFFLLLYWVHQANLNVRQLGAQGMKFSPGAAIGWFFVPLANLFFIPKIMNEIWKTSKNPSAWQNEPDEPLILRWFWFWVIASAFSAMADRLYNENLPAEQLVLPTALELLTGLCSLVSVVALISVIKKIYAMQMSHVQADK